MLPQQSAVEGSVKRANVQPRPHHRHQRHAESVREKMCNKGRDRAETDTKVEKERGEREKKRVKEESDQGKRSDEEGKNGTEILRDREREENQRHSLRDC